ncbi:MAG TPA: type II toxin-antitoxin system RelE/ParE family toxin [Candidatus Dormibacteraeota bacterium]|nr:type II toxin-antitoxin system RelE/ParE family toxin [Candidatus Dormibacteraeota bacterium]
MACQVGPDVEPELDSIWEYITDESGSPETARRVVHSITKRFALLGKHPHIGRTRDDLRRGLRSFAVGSFVIIYRIDGDDVLILHVLHGRRDIQNLFGD